MPTLDFNTLTPAAPYVIGSAPDNLTGCALYGANPIKIVQRTLRVLEIHSGSSAVLYYTTALTGTEIRSSVRTSSTGSAWGGPGLIDSATGHGYYAQRDRTANRVYLFKLVAGAQGAQIGAFISNTFVDNQKLTIGKNPTTHDIKLYIDDVQIGTTFNDATYSPNKAAAITQGMSLYSLSSEVVSAQSLTIATDVTPGASRTDTCGGFPNGAAVISFAGVSVPVTIASGSFTWTVPMLADGVVWPRIPSTGTAITLTQGGISANATCNITLPSGYNTLREGDVDSGAPANFTGIVTDDPKFIGYHIALTTSDTWYNPTLNGLRVFRNGDVGSNEFLGDGTTPALPRTDLEFKQNTTTGLVSAHTITLTAAGDIISVSNGMAGASIKSSKLVSSKLKSSRI